MRKEVAKIDKRIPVLLFIICAVVSVVSANNEGGYPYICVSGIMFDEDKPLAVVNDQVVGQRDSVEGAKILKITNSYVRFEYKDKVFDKKIGEGCKKVVQPVYEKTTAGDKETLLRYSNLLSLPKIKNNIIWQGSRYTSWAVDQKEDLNNAILALERGERWGLLKPPTSLGRDYPYISAADAWKIYIAHVAQTLWVEVHGVVSWHLTDFPDNQLVYLLDSRKLMKHSRFIDGSGYWFTIGKIMPWNPRICYKFLSSKKMIKSSQLETIYALTKWMRHHLIHISASDDYKEQYGYSGPPPVDKILYPLKGKRHKTAGCWGTTGLYAAVLRSVNIPVESATIKFSGPGGRSIIHSRPVFPSVDRSMPHADDVYSRVFIPSGAVIPVSKLFYTLDQMDKKFINPKVDCFRGKCNTIAEQASYNTAKAERQLACDYMADYILYKYSAYGADYLNDSLRGARGWNEPVREYVKPYFTRAERAAMVKAVEKRIKEIGRGNLEAGKKKVKARYNRFFRNK